MNYLPGLRDSLVKAARETYADTPEPPGRRYIVRRLSTGGLATALGIAIAVAVAAVVLVGLGDRPSSDRSASSAGPSRIAIRDAAARTLSRLVLPPGAVASGLVRGTPIELWSPSDNLSIASRADVYRVWRLRESPDRVIRFIEAHRPLGSSLGIGTESSGSSTPVRPGGARQSPSFTIEQETVSIDFPGTSAGLWRELALDAVTLRSGETALRVDSEAGWLAPRPAADRIRSGVVRVRYWFTRRGHRSASQVIANPQRVHAFVSLFNSLPAVPPGTGACKRGLNGTLSFAFEGGDGTTPLAVATWPLSCRSLDLTIGGHQISALAGSPTMPAGAQIVELLVPSLREGHLSGSPGTRSATVSHSSTAISPPSQTP